MARERVPLVFGGSMERNYGKMAVRPGSIEDQRNVYLLTGKALIRRGMEETATFVDENGDPMTDIVGIAPQRTERVGIVVGYQGVTGKLYIFRVTVFGEDPVRLDVDHRTSATAPADVRAYWHELDPGTVSESGSPPIIFMADSFQKLFIAHTFQNIADRAPTVYYNPLSSTPVDRLFLELRPGFKPTTPGYSQLPVYFNGVVRHLQYIFGWGYGSSAEPDRPEYLRHSLPGEPTVWDALHYQIVGQRGEPIKNAVPAAKILVSLKDTELHRTFGFDRSTFGVEPLDPDYGIGAPRLAIPFKRGVAFWSSDGGPRWTNGTDTSEDLDADQLGLLGLDPEDLVAAGELEAAFACNLLTRKVLYFFFGARGYAYHYGLQRSYWSYDPRAVPLMCAGELFVGDEESIGPPVGHPECIAQNDPYFPWDPGDFSACPKVRNIDPLGGEILEVWLRIVDSPEIPWDTSPYALYDVNAGLPVQELNNPCLGDTPLEALEQDTLYEIAYRWRRGGSYTPGWEGATPDDWSSAAAVSKCFFTTSNDLRIIAEATWERTSGVAEEIQLILFGGPSDTTDVESSTSPSSGFAAIAGSPFGIGVTVVQEDTSAFGEQYRYYRVKPTSGVIYSPVVEKWVGPPTPTGCVGNTIDNTTLMCQVGDDGGIPGYEVIATNVIGWVFGQVELTAGPAGTVQERFTGNPPVLDPSNWTVFAVVNQPARIPVFQFQEPVILQIEWSTAGGAGPTVETSIGLDLTYLEFVGTRDGSLMSVRARNKTTTFGVDDFSDYTPSLEIPNSDD